jgi:PAS domain S-box-containing protein
LLFSAAVVLIGAAVLIGWSKDIVTLKSILPGGTTMKSNTALLLLIQGVAVLLLSLAQVDSWARRYATLAGFVSVAIAGLSLCETFFGFDAGIDQWLFAEAPGAPDTPYPGRMSPPGAFCLLLTGICLIVASRTSPARPRAPTLLALSTSAFLVGGLTLLGHLCWLAFGIHIWNFSGFAIHTAAGCCLLGAAIICWTKGRVSIDWSLNVTTTLGFATGLVAIVAVAGVSYSLTAQLRQNWNRLDRSEEMLRDIEKLGSAQRDLTLGIGRYVITHDAAAIAERPRVIRSVNEQIVRLRILTARDPSQRGRIEQIAQLTERRIALSDQIIAAQGERSSAGSAPPGGLPQSSDSHRTLESPLGEEYPAVGAQTDRVLKEMDAAEYAALQGRVAHFESGATNTFLELPVGVYLSFTLLLLGLFNLNQWAHERTVAERERSDMEAYFRTMFQASPDGILVTDTERKIVMVNAAAETMFGYAAVELLARRIEEIVPFADVREVVDERAELVETPTELRVGKTWETEATRKDGTVFPLEFRRSAFSTMRGVFVLGVVRDISERKRVNETTARIAAIVEFSDDAIIGKNLQGIVSSWNRGAQKIFGYSTAEMVGQSILRIVPADRTEEELDILRRVRRGEVIEHFETVRQTKSGHLIDVAISVSPIKDVRGMVIGASKIGRDITVSKHLEQRLRQSQKMEAIGQLTGGIAHDFNNLLGVVLGNIDLLERLVSGNEAAVKRVQNAQKAALRGADLTRRLLAFSSRQPLHAVSLNLRDPIENMIEMAKRTLGPEIRISTDFDDSIPPVLADAAGLENALLNLAVNARDAMPDGGSILIATSLGTLTPEATEGAAAAPSEQRFACVRVCDTGQGMSRETLERAFEPFFTTKPRGKGTGLGLAMVYGFARQSGGTVRIYSELGVGTTVSLYLPLADKEAMQTPVQSRQELPPVNGLKVLVVDDEVDLLEIAVAYLDGMGLTVFHAIDGNQAIEILERVPDIALMVTDVMMPGGMDGVELARRARVLVPGLKIIYSSGFPSDALAQRSGTRVDGPLLYKPYQRQKFVDMVSQGLVAQDSTGAASLHMAGTRS